MTEGADESVGDPPTASAAREANGEGESSADSSAADEPSTASCRLPTPPPPQNLQESRAMPPLSYRHISDWAPPQNVAIAELVAVMHRMWAMWIWHSELNSIWRYRDTLRNPPAIITRAMRIDARRHQVLDFGRDFTQVQRETSDAFTAQLTRIMRFRGDNNRAKPRCAA